MARRSRIVRLAASIAMFPVTVILVLFAISNRHSVEVHFWPMLTGLDLPLYLVSLVAMVVGFLIGGSVAWAAAGDSRRRVRAAERQVRFMKTRLRTTDDETDTIRAISSAAGD